MALAEVAVAHRGLNVSVAQDLFYAVVVCSRHDATRRGRMAEGMPVGAGDAARRNAGRKTFLRKLSGQSGFSGSRTAGNTKGDFAKLSKVLRFALAPPLIGTCRVFPDLDRGMVARYFLGRCSPTEG